MIDEEIDTANKFLIGMAGDTLVFMTPVPQRLSHADALLLAAYIVAMVGDDEQWERVRQAVENA